MIRTRTFAAVAVAALALSACAPKPPAQLPPQPGATGAGANGTANGGNPAGWGPAGSANGGGTGANGTVAGSHADFVATLAGQDTIYFDTDRYNLDSADQSALAMQAAWLQRNPSRHATIEGHCDERGTREYNLALGERRANAAKNYLVTLGIDPARLTTVSYGKERPVALESNEAAWAKNRRAVTVTID